MATADEARQAKKRHGDELLGRPGVVGVGTTSREGSWLVVVYVTDESAAIDIPPSLDGVPVTTVLSGTLRAQPGSSYS